MLLTRYVCCGKIIVCRVLDTPKCRVLDTNDRSKLDDACFCRIAANGKKKMRDARNQRVRFRSSGHSSVAKTGVAKRGSAKMNVAVAFAIVVRLLSPL
jgi:hypothetical protein